MYFEMNTLTFVGVLQALEAMIKYKNEDQLEYTKGNTNPLSVLISSENGEFLALEQEYLKLLSQQDISAKMLEKAYSMLVEKYPSSSSMPFSAIYFNENNQLCSYHSGGHHLFLLRGGMLIRLNKKDNSTISTFINQDLDSESTSEVLENVKLIHGDLLLLCPNRLLNYVDSYYLQKIVSSNQTLAEKKQTINDILQKETTESISFILKEVKGKVEKQPLATPMNQKQKIFKIIQTKDFIAFASMVGFVGLILGFHLFTFSNLTSDKEDTKAKNEILLADLDKKDDQLASIIANEKLEKDWIIQRSFDRLDTEKCRLYALFRDDEGVLKSSDVAHLFHVPTATIKYIPVGKEGWFIVPVKGVHFVKKGDTFKKVAKQYYADQAKAAVLLQMFNRNWQIGKYAFLPFEEN